MMNAKDRNDEYLKSIMDGIDENRLMKLQKLFIDKEKSFDANEYCEEFVKIYPEFKGNEEYIFPEFDEENIKLMVNSYLYCVGDWKCDGDSSMQEVRDKLGIDVASHFKLPNDMSPLEYEKYRVCKYIVTPLHDDVKYGSQIDEEKDLNEQFSKGLVQAWRNLHGISQENAIELLQEEAKKLEELNPELNKLKFDRNNVKDLWNVVCGVTYDFPVEDIQMFTDRYREGVLDRIERGPIVNDFIKKHGLEGKYRFGWCPSDKTLENIEQKLQEKQSMEISTNKVCDKNENSEQSNKDSSLPESVSKSLCDDKSSVSKKDGYEKAKENLNKGLSEAVVETKISSNTKTNALSMGIMKKEGR